MEKTRAYFTSTKSTPTAVVDTFNPQEQHLYAQMPYIISVPQSEKSVANTDVKIHSSIQSEMYK